MATRLPSVYMDDRKWAPFLLRSIIEGPSKSKNVHETYPRVIAWMPVVDIFSGLCCFRFERFLRYILRPKSTDKYWELWRYQNTFLASSLIQTLRQISLAKPHFLIFKKAQDYSAEDRQWGSFPSLKTKSRMLASVRGGVSYDYQSGWCDVRSTGCYQCAHRPDQKLSSYYPTTGLPPCSVKRNSGAAEALRSGGPASSSQLLTTSAPRRGHWLSHCSNSAEGKCRFN